VYEPANKEEIIAKYIVAVKPKKRDLSYRCSVERMACPLANDERFGASAK